VLRNSIAALGQTVPSDKPPTGLEQTLMAPRELCRSRKKKGTLHSSKRILTSDFSFVPFDGQWPTARTMIDQLGGGGVDILPYDMKVVPVSDDVAIVTYDVVLRAPPLRIRVRLRAISTSARSGSAGRLLEDEISENVGVALGRLVGTGCSYDRK